MGSCPRARGRVPSTGFHCAERLGNALEYDQVSYSSAGLTRWDRVLCNEFFYRLSWYPHASSALDPRELSQAQPKTYSPFLNSQALGNLLDPE